MAASGSLSGISLQDLWVCSESWGNGICLTSDQSDFNLWVLPVQEAYLGAGDDGGVWGRIVQDAQSGRASSRQATVDVPLCNH